MSEIFIVDLDKAEVLAALFNGAQTQGAGFMQHSDKPMTASDARPLIEKYTYFDYVQGRVMKVDLSGDCFDPEGYDRDNGQGAAERTISALRSTDMVNPEEVEMQRLEGTREAAEEAPPLAQAAPAREQEVCHEGRCHHDHYYYYDPGPHA